MAYQRRKEKEILDTQTNVRMSKEMRDWLEELADKNKRTMGDIVRFCIQHCIDEKWEP